VTVFQVYLQAITIIIISGLHTNSA